MKKAAVIFNFCLIGNIHHNFLVPRMIESAPKTFMPIQTPDLDRVPCNFPVRDCCEEMYFLNSFTYKVEKYDIL